MAIAFKCCAETRRTLIGSYNRTVRAQRNNSLCHASLNPRLPIKTKQPPNIMFNDLWYKNIKKCHQNRIDLFAGARIDLRNNSQNK